MAKKEAVEIVMIVDRSGSMSAIKGDAIGGFNQFLEDQKKVKGAANLTVVLFDDRYEVPVSGVSIKDAQPLTDKTFVPRGCTAMYDAIGKAIGELEAKAPKRAIICILTDGAENASREYKAEQVKDRIKACEARGWRVVYLAANQDAFASGAAIGVNVNFTQNFAASGVGVRSAYTTLSNTTMDYRGAGHA